MLCSATASAKRRRGVATRRRRHSVRRRLPSLNAPPSSPPHTARPMKTGMSCRPYSPPMLCYAMQCNAMQCHAMLCDAMLCHAMLRYVLQVVQPSLAAEGAKGDQPGVRQLSEAANLVA